MGLLELLSNPQMIGMAMAGLSRDPDAPMNAMKSLGMVEDINQKRAALAKQEQQRAATVQALKTFGGAIGQEQPPDLGIYDAHPELKNYINSQYQRNLGTRNSLSQALSGMGPDADPVVMTSIINHMGSKNDELNKFPLEILKSQLTKDKDPSTEWGFINQEVKAGRLSPEEAKQLLFDKLKPKPKEANMQPAYDMVGTKLMGSAYQTVEGRSQFAELYKTDPKVQQLVDGQVEREAKLKFQGFPPLYLNMGVSGDAGAPVNLNARTGQTVIGTAPAGGIQPKNLPEDFKKDLTAINQAEDLVNRLEENWNKVGVEGRGSAVVKYIQGKTGFNPQAKLYSDQSNAFLGNLSRSIAAERGVLTQQDIERIQKAIAKIGLDPTSVDTSEEAKLKWNEVRGVVKDARKRMGQRSQMTQSNPTGEGSQPITQVPNKPKFKILKVEP